MKRGRLTSDSEHECDGNSGEKKARQTAAYTVSHPKRGLRAHVTTYRLNGPLPRTAATLEVAGVTPALVVVVRETLAVGLVTV